MKPRPDLRGLRLVSFTFIWIWFAIETKTRSEGIETIAAFTASALLTVLKPRPDLRGLRLFSRISSEFLNIAIETKTRSEGIETGLLAGFDNGENASIETKTRSEGIETQTQRLFDNLILN